MSSFFALLTYPCSSYGLWCHYNSSLIHHFTWDALHKYHHSKWPSGWRTARTICCDALKQWYGCSVQPGICQCSYHWQWQYVLLWWYSITSIYISVHKSIGWAPTITCLPNWHVYRVQPKYTLSSVVNRYRTCIPSALCSYDRNAFNVL